ncbi:ArdA family antirestriction protein [Buttiauxella gaviniae ATCC 51604]|uniref:ArdA family antirestriction protein n=1 Tax=Buttiauxella gaviniae ATCC 51604 TaxID=1354253 RepID=A0A1B7HLD2_9ENTR|nr:ArdA family antirestriction protein [Buttiauxella gaviniae ATCC 51604]
MDYTGDCDFDRFEAAYCGEAEDEEDYAREYVDSTGMLSEVPQSLRDYFDFEHTGHGQSVDGCYDASR